MKKGGGHMRLIEIFLPFPPAGYHLKSYPDILVYMVASIKDETKNLHMDTLPSPTTHMHMWLDLQKLSLLANFVFREIPFWNIEGLKQLWFSYATL